MTNDRTPQMRAISSNTCPNAKPRGMTDVSTCDLNAMTTWGYCTSCWESGRVSATWAAAVDRHIERAIRP